LVGFGDRALRVDGILVAAPLRGIGLMVHL